MFYRKLLKNFTWSIIILVLTLSVLGAFNLYSISLYSDLYVFKKQLIWFFIGIVLMFSLLFITEKTIRRYTVHIYLLSILALVCVIIFGKEVSGSKSWIGFSQFSVQPSEFAKIAVILIFARFYNNNPQDDQVGSYALIKLILLVSPIFVLIAMQPDLGTLMVILLICGSLLIFMGIKVRSFLMLLLLLAITSIPTWQLIIKDYHKERILTFVDPARDPLGMGYNSIQSQIAVGSGKLDGKGLGSGGQSHLMFIPEKETDFVFSVLAEEWGFIGAALVLILYFFLILLIFDVASSAKDKFSLVACVGIAMLFFWHLCLNVGMVLGLLPVVGVPLIFFSYGGSSVVTAYLAVGIVIGIKMRQLVTTERMLFMD